MNLQVAQQPTADLAYTPYVYMNPMDYANLMSMSGMPLGASSSQIIHASVFSKVFPVKQLDKVAAGTIALSNPQRTYCSAVLDARADVTIFSPPRDKFALSEVTFKITVLGKSAPPKTAAGGGDAAPPSLQLEATKLEEDCKKVFHGMVLGMGQKLFRLSQDTSPPTALQMEVVGFKHSQVTAAGNEDNKKTTMTLPPFGSGTTEQMGIFIANVTKCLYVRTEGVVIKGQNTTTSSHVFMEVDFGALGIGGLDNEFTEIFRRAFASRVYPAKMVADMGLTHVRGLMLYGPPGCGKTLIARQISKALQKGESSDPNMKKREPKVVNGPEVLSKFVGETEANIRALFAEAEADEREFGEASELHVIIFDEIDAIAKKRGSTRDGTGVHDSLVNQLLSKIDGVDSLNNVLLIGMTNRLDMLDPALLRPGRFEVQVEISLPDEQGRVQILNIHTAKMRKAGYLDPSVNMQTLAAMTKNFTGAEIEGLVKDAGSWAFQRQIDRKDLRKVLDPKSVRVTQADFEEALKECHPAFGATDAEEELKRQFEGGIIPFSPHFEHVSNMLNDLCKKTLTVPRSGEVDALQLVSVLVAGEPGCGKTALAAKIAFDAKFPFLRVISPDKFIGMAENTKCAAIADAFEEAYKSAASLLLIEDLERLIEYSRVGQRFSNQVLQTLLIFVRRVPPKSGRRLMIMATTSIPDLIEPLDLISVFNMVLRVPQVSSPEEVMVVAQHMCNNDATQMGTIESIAAACSLPISVKRLMIALDMSKDEEGKFSRGLFETYMTAN